MPGSVLLSAMAISAGAAHDDLRVDLPNREALLQIDVFTLVDQTTVSTRLELYLGSANAIYPLRAVTPAQLGESVELLTPIVMSGDYHLIARVVGATSGDVLQATVLGRYLE